MEEKEQVVARTGKKSLAGTNTQAQSAGLPLTPNGKGTPSDMPLLPTIANTDEKTWDLLVAKAKALAELTSTLAGFPSVGMKFVISPYRPKAVSGNPVSLVIMVFDDTYDLGKVVSGTGTIEASISGRSGMDIMRENATKSEKETA